MEGLGVATQGLGERERETEVVGGQHVSAPLAGRPDKDDENQPHSAESSAPATIGREAPLTDGRDVAETRSRLPLQSPPFPRVAWVPIPVPVPSRRPDMCGISVDVATTADPGRSRTFPEGKTPSIPDFSRLVRL